MSELNEGVTGVGKQKVNVLFPCFKAFKLYDIICISSFCPS